MKNLIIAFFLLINFNIVFAQKDVSIEIFNEMLAAFNDHDVDRMTEMVSEDMEYFYVMADSLVTEIKGQEAFKEAMTEYFENVSNVNSRILESFQHGEMVSFKEEVSWGENDDRKTSRSIGVYQIKEEKIYRAWYFIQE